jgi:hypothetical protein
MPAIIPNLKIDKQPMGEVGLLQGIIPGSRNEWHFGLALEKLRLNYIFQYQIGGRGERGSQRVDFLVMIAPASQACYIQGAYWHSTRTADEDRLKHAIAEHLFGRGNVHDFSEEETETVEAAVTSIRKKLL